MLVLMIQILNQKIMFLQKLDKEAEQSLMISI